MDSSHDLEHVAFLVAWLSYFLFPLSGDCINEAVFSIAIHLSRGVKVALGQAVLSKLYAELGLLKNHILAFGESKVTDKKIEVTGLFKLVQVWTWERFKELRPRPNQLAKGEPRLALWHEKHREDNDVRRILDNSKMDDSTSSSEEDVGAGPSSSKQKTKKGKGKGSNKKPTGKVTLHFTDGNWPEDVPHDCPDALDWSTKDILRKEVSDQGTNELCWAVALRENIEASMNLKAKREKRLRPPKLSAQHLVNNVAKQTSGAMRRYEGVTNFLVNEGLVTEEKCEFTGSILQNGCSHGTSDTEPVTKIKGLNRIKGKHINERELIKLVNEGPVVVETRAYKRLVKFKSDGVYPGPDRKEEEKWDRTALSKDPNELKKLTRHALLLIGYGTINGVHYWLVKNSYGTGWGEGGYGKIIRQSSSGKDKSLFVKIRYPVV